MPTYGVNLKIDVSKVVKEKMFKGEKGVYLDATVFVNTDEKDQYDNNGMITQNWKDQQKGEGPILGNARVFWEGSQQKRQEDYRGHTGSNQKNPTTEPADDMSDWDSDKIPF